MPLVLLTPWPKVASVHLQVIAISSRGHLLSCRAESAELLRKSGHKATRQRLIILTTLRHAGGHVTASEIYERVRESHPYVDISTVYRTLAVLKEMRLVAETDMRTGEYTYEWIRPRRHHHLICRGCGASFAFGDDLMEPLRARFLKKYGFSADLEHFAVFGLCLRCKRARAP